MSWVIRVDRFCTTDTGILYEVGYYRTVGAYEPEALWISHEKGMKQLQARYLCHYLNGGSCHYLEEQP